MPEIIEYRVAFGDSRAELANIVNNLIARGWQPLSGIDLRNYDNNSPDFYQAMVKYKQSEANSI